MIYKLMKEGEKKMEMRLTRESIEFIMDELWELAMSNSEEEFKENGIELLESQGIISVIEEE